VLSRYDPAARRAVEKRRQELMTAMMLISRAAIAEQKADN
jgi:hypothetical protein